MLGGVDDRRMAAIGRPGLVSCCGSRIGVNVALRVGLLNFLEGISFIDEKKSVKKLLENE